ESGETGLEDAMELYKEGIALSKSCGELLDRYENEISVLVKQSDDTFSLKPFNGARPEAL
ncbi:MAG: exodeoxyribonuclease VII small subunit, partial [Defluviitaleaceae bacterium]|nr:exodeoxyribonuclease VII small subunit [Defluviitaleaceae bacterium]